MYLILDFFLIIVRKVFISWIDNKMFVFSLLLILGCIKNV